MRTRLRVSVGAGGSEIRGGWEGVKEPPQVPEPTWAEGHAGMIAAPTARVRLETGGLP